MTLLPLFLSFLLLCFSLGFANYSIFAGGLGSMQALRGGSSSPRRFRWPHGHGPDQPHAPTSLAWPRPTSEKDLGDSAAPPRKVNMGISLGFVTTPSGAIALPAPSREGRPNVLLIQNQTRVNRQQL